MPEFYYKLLQRICEKPYIDYQGLREDFCHKKDLDFQQGLDFLWLNDYIIVKPFKSAAEDTGESYLIRNSNGAVKPIKIGPYMHLISSVRGTTFVDDRRRRFWGVRYSLCNYNRHFSRFYLPAVLQYFFRLTCHVEHHQNEGQEEQERRECVQRITIMKSHMFNPFSYPFSPAADSESL